MTMTMATAGLALVTWTMVVWFWLFATRLPAFTKAKVDVDKSRRPSDINKHNLPDRVLWVGDNYAHLHEQPVLFYFLVLYSQAYGVKDDLNVTLAFAYVGVRVVHSIWQNTVNAVLPRFLIFVIGSFILMAILARNLMAAMA